MDESDSGPTAANYDAYQHLHTHTHTPEYTLTNIHSQHVKPHTQHLRTAWICKANTHIAYITYANPNEKSTEMIYWNIFLIPNASLCLFLLVLHCFILQWINEIRFWWPFSFFLRSLLTCLIKGLLGNNNCRQIPMNKCLICHHVPALYAQCVRHHERKIPATRADHTKQRYYIRFNYSKYISRPEIISQAKEN